MTPDEMCQTDNPNTVAPDRADMWAAARGELLGYATHLERRGAGITASQLRLAVARADLFGDLLAFVLKVQDAMPPTLRVLAGNVGVADDAVCGAVPFTASGIRGLCSVVAAASKT